MSNIISDIESFGNAQQYAQEQLAKPFRQIVLENLYALRELDKESKQFATFFAQGGGATWNDVIAAIEDNSELGQKYLDEWQLLVYADMQSRGIAPVTVKQLEKNKPKWE